MSQHKSLLVCPKNLKECMDWLLCIHGQGKISELASAVENVLGDSHSGPLDLKALASGLADFIGYSGSAVTGRGIVRRDYVKFFEGLSSSSHSSPCPHCEALRPVFPVGSCSLLCECAEKFKAFVEDVQKAFPPLKPKASHGLSKQVQNILKLKPSTQNNISGLKTSFGHFALAFGNLKRVCATVSSKAFSSTPGSTPKNIAEGLYGFLHSGVEGWSGALERALEEAEKIPGKALKKKDSKEFNALLSALKVFLSNLKAQYALAYSSAKWNLLCSHTSPCSGCQDSCPCHPSAFLLPASACSDGSCCDNCDVKKAAKIFLGFLPALYFGLKIVHERCKDGSGFAGWHDISMDPNGKPESALANFLYAWGYTDKELNVDKKASEISELLSSIFTPSSDILKKLYNASLKYFSKKYSGPTSGSFPSSLSTSHSKDPLTVRSMLLWLYGLRFQKHFSDLVENCKSFCIPFGNSFNSDAFCYYIHVSCFLLSVSVISVIQCSEGSDSFLPSPSDWHNFSYPSDTLELFEKSCDYIRKIYIPLTFLKFQCERGRDQAGWQFCYFGSKCKVELLLSSVTSLSSLCCSTSAPNGYLCTASQSISNKDVHGKHCASGQCINSGSGCTQGSTSDHNKDSKTGQGSNCVSCPHPLQRFLIDDSSEPKPENSQKFRTPFHFPTVTPMGFSAKDLPSPAKKGEKLYPVIDVFCKEGFYPLARLVEFSLFVTLRPPETFLELYVFFVRFISHLGSEPFKKHFVQWISKEPGRYSGEIFVATVKNLYGSEKDHWKSKGQHNVFKSPLLADLRSLSDCDGPRGSTCGKYLFALYNVSGVFSENLLGLYLSFLCHLGAKFYYEFQDFYKKASEKFSSCCLSSSSPPCQKIVECPCALPFLYSFGFSFYAPKILNNKAAPKKCSDFIDQLRLVADGHLFKNLLRIIDEFIWHIRLPFIYAFLYIWILVISYFYYVQFYKLDLLHIDSHLHLPRSFKILPSTLFSDASSKLKDLSYFTL